MRKRLTAKLFKRLSLAALVLSLVAWGLSEFCVAYAAGSNKAVEISGGSITFTYGQVFFMPGNTNQTKLYWSEHPGFDLPAPTFLHLLVCLIKPCPCFDVVMPFWVPSLTALAAFLFFRRLDRRSAVAPGCCVHCGYDASKCTDNRCSECGEPLAVEAAAAG